MGTTRSGGTGTPATRYLYMSACCSSSSYCAGVNGSGLVHLPLNCASPPPLPLHQHTCRHVVRSKENRTNEQRRRRERESKEEGSRAVAYADEGGVGRQ
jgi:hypothetical protein